MKRIIALFALLALLTVSASAAYIPEDVLTENRDGRQLVIKTYTLSPQDDPADLVQPPFDLDGFHYEHMETVKEDKIIVTGDSAGGNLAAAVTLMLWDRMHISPLGAMLIYPVTDRRMITESMKKYTDTPVWDATLTKMFWKAYLGNQEIKQIQYASPIEAESLEHFPNVYMEVAEFDCLRDEGIAFAERLRAEGVFTELYEVKGACHGYETVLESRIVEKAMQRRIQWIQSVLNK